jgi:plastocyanin
MQWTALLVAGIASLASAKTINIDATDYKFTPGASTAQKGDVLVFHFYPHQHNVAQGTFDKPCAPLNNGFFSGTVSAPSGPANTTFSVEVKDDKPIWFYCSVGKHCQNGMVGVIKPP